MTKNQQAMRNLARGSACAQIEKSFLIPKSRRRLKNGALKHWQELDVTRTKKYQEKRIRNRVEKTSGQQA